MMCHCQVKGNASPSAKSIFQKMCELLFDYMYPFYHLYYYKRSDSTLETDFFIRSAKSLIPIEVKAKSGKSKSMKTLISSDYYSDIRYGFKLSKNNIGHENRIYTFPYFCSFLLKRYMADFHPIEEDARV